MPAFTVDDFQNILQKITVLETKIHQIEVNVEMNGLCDDSLMQLVALHCLLKRVPLQRPYQRGNNCGQQ